MYDIDQELFNGCLDVSDILFNQIWKKCSEHERYTFPCGYSTSKDYVRVDLNFRPRVMKESSVNPQKCIVYRRGGVKAYLLIGKLSFLCRIEKQPFKDLHQSLSSILSETAKLLFFHSITRAYGSSISGRLLF